MSKIQLPSKTELQSLLKLPKEQQQEAVELINELQKRKQYEGGIYHFFPDDGELKRELYVKRLHLDEHTIPCHQEPLPVM